MLTELSIQNFAIIDRLLVRFGSGFTVVTGETGAGKSIIIDALQVALGGRASNDMVRTDAKQAAVEAVFDWPEAEGAQALLDELGIEDEGCLILRREITAAGRSSARVNGRTVPVSTLAVIGAQLVDIHGQSDHLSVLRRDRQLDALDRFAHLLDIRSETADAVREYSRVQGELQSLREGQRAMEQKLDLLRFQVNEIEGASLHATEDDELEAERRLLVNAERLAELAAQGYEALQGESAVLEGVVRAGGAALDLQAIDPTLGSVAERLEATRYELEDLAEEFRRYRDAVEFDPHRLATVEERLDVLARLRRKYGPTTADVIEFGRQARLELDAAEHFDERVADLEMEVAAAERRAGELAGRLSAAREEAAERLGVAMGAALHGLGLRSTRFEVQLSRQESPDGIPIPPGETRFLASASGIDTVTFLVSFNVGEPLRPLERVASGGETSRFLLALKGVLAETDETPTLIFDEVDVGVGGRNGIVVGERLKHLAGTHQVISITHLPQVAALGDQHFHVLKAVRDGQTAVAIRELDGGERVSELAEMMSGTGTDAARRSAEELLAEARRSG